MQSIISISGLSKTYASGFAALKRVDLDIRRGEIFALLGPNGAGKTTLISIICGIVNASTGSVVADGHDIVSDPRGARRKIGRGNGSIADLYNHIAGLNFFIGNNLYTYKYTNKSK